MRLVNFDGMVGPTHHFGGLSYGNIASLSNAKSVSSPRRAALEALAKMKLLHDLGFTQGVLPPQERPHLPTLRRLGFSGSDRDVIQKAYAYSPEIYYRVTSASSMWSANSATVAPSADTTDGTVHITPANLISFLHRSIEPAGTARVLARIFSDQQHFTLHDPLPTESLFSDEGSANHMRLAKEIGKIGYHIFVYGDPASATRYPARQRLTASHAIARLHTLAPDRTFFFEQHPDAIAEGVFHNDVAAVANKNVLFLHERAYRNQKERLAELKTRFPELEIIQVAESDLSLKETVDSYLFNSQLLHTPDHKRLLIAPSECRHIEPLLRQYPFDEVRFVALSESMKNGGGPACLRLALELTEEEYATVHQGVILTDSLHNRLRAWIETHYRDEITPQDLADPQLMEESFRALDELTNILQLGSIYPFQDV